MLFTTPFLKLIGSPSSTSTFHARAPDNDEKTNRIATTAVRMLIHCKGFNIKVSNAGS